jgi:hypothetical protein
VSPRVEVPERVNQEINTEKYRNLLPESVNGIHNFVGVSKSSTYNSEFFCDTVVPSCLRKLLSIPKDNYSDIYASAWTMHVRIMQGDPLNVFTQKDPADTALSSQPGPRTK